MLKLAAALAAGFGINGLPESVNASLKKLSSVDIPKIVYLQGLSCTGCSISLLQSSEPSPLALITDYSKLAFHADLSATTGQQALDLIDSYISGEAGDYFLALEGAVPYDMPEACVIGNKTYAEYIEEATKTMSGAIAVGTCAAFGGIPAAEGNLTGAISIKEFYNKLHINPLLITIPGCPVHPDWLSNPSRVSAEIDPCQYCAVSL